MAKGDSSRSQNQIDYQGKTAQNTLNNVTGKMNDQYGNFTNNYNNAAKTNAEDYGNIMQGYKDTQAGIAGGYQPIMDAARSMATGASGGVGLDNSKVDAAINGFQGFADTGGFSNGDIQDIRARAVSPTRSIYSSAQANLARGNELTGGYSPNNAAAQTKMARDMSQQISDADTSANSNIAQMVQQGKLYGLTGMSNAALQQQSNAIQAGSVNNNAKLGGINAWAGAQRDELGAQYAGLGGMRDLYGTTPGMMSTTGNQLLGAQGNLLTGSAQQNQLSLGLTGAQNQKAQIPGDFAQGIGNISSGLGLVGDVAGAASGLPMFNKQQPNYNFGLVGGF